MKAKLINENITSDYGKNLLKARGILNVEQFLNPEYSDLESWELLLNIRKGVEVLRAALDSKKPFALVVDSDVDGYTSAAIIYQYLKRLNPNL